MHNWKQEQRANDYRRLAAPLRQKTEQGVTAQAHEHATPRPLSADATYRQAMLDEIADA
jgi:hypothetical protein